MFRTSAAGHSYSEYAIIFAIVLVVCLVSLSGLGGSISSLLSDKVGGSLGADGGASVGVMGILKPLPPAAPKIDPVSGLPIVRFKDAGNSATNATSIPGQHMNEVGMMMLAKTMRQIAESQQDPNLAAAYRLAADKMYLMGAAQGAAKGLPELKIPTRNIPGQKGSKGFLGIFGKKKERPPQSIDYNRADASSDVVRFQTEINAAMQSIPANMNDPDYVTAMALVQDANAIGQKFVEDPANATYLATGRRVDDPDALSNVDQVKAKADAVLADNQVEDVPVKVTFTDARMTEQIANKKKGSLLQKAQSVAGSTQNILN